LRISFKLDRLKSTALGTCLGKNYSCQEEVKVLYAYKFDLAALRGMLKNAPEAGTGRKTCRGFSSDN
jgi:hypothetical protein